MTYYLYFIVLLLILLVVLAVRLHKLEKEFSKFKQFVEDRLDILVRVSHQHEQFIATVKKHSQELANRKSRNAR